jgi:hypothetical protein
VGLTSSIQAERSVNDATRDDFKAGAVENLLNKRNWAVLTGENPNATPAPAAANAASNKRLEADLRRMDVDYQKVRGRYGGEEENSFAVTGITQEQAMELRDKYHQDSYLTHTGFEHNDGTVTPAKSISEMPGDATDYYTVMPNGTKWAADMDWEGRTKSTLEQPAKKAAPGNVMVTALEAGTGNEVQIEMPAQQALQDIDSEIQKLEELRLCLSS